ncbi:hypothetical protein N7537_007512, partial [Penicillium hordei]
TRIFSLLAVTVTASSG